MPATDRPPSFQFYPRDFLSDAAVRRMNAAARGAYITLLCTSWLEEEPGVIQDNDELLASMAGVTPREWKKLREAIARAFVISDGWWRQKRMILERDTQRMRMQTASEAGSKGAAKRWGAHSNPIGSAIATPMPGQCDSMTPSSASALTPESNPHPTASAVPAPEAAPSRAGGGGKAGRRGAHTPVDRTPDPEALASAVATSASLPPSAGLEAEKRRQLTDLKRWQREQGRS
jgi:uncharacterized protein YdaU (DUF1376 family)